MTTAMAQRSRILVVDDDAHIVSSLRRALVYEGYDVQTAGDGVEGLARARETAETLIGLLPSVDLVLDPRLREYDVGMRQGLTFPEFEAKYPEAFASFMSGVEAGVAGV